MCNFNDKQREETTVIFAPQKNGNARSTPRAVQALTSLLGAAAVTLFASTANAAELMPDFSTAPAGWTVDRYAPDSFSNVGTYQGATNVLGIGIGANGAAANRGGESDQFYDTQGEGYIISGAAGDSLSADVYIPASWLNASNGAVRTDMWGVMTDSTSTISDYPIMGFTNEGTGGYVGFQVWDDTLNAGNGGWMELGASGNTNSWNALSIDFTGTDFLYFLNGVQVYDQSNTFGSVDFSEVIMQAYNFDDPANFPSAVADPYTAYWANADSVPVPEPGTIALLLSGLGLAAFFGYRRRSSKI
jgi:hypothetical protein